MWTQYAHVRANTLPPLWKKFLLNIGCEECCSEPLLMELINESIVYCFIKETFPQFETSRAATRGVFLVHCLLRLKVFQLSF